MATRWVGSSRPLLLALAGCAVMLTIAVATLSSPSADRVALSESSALKIAEGSSQGQAAGSQRNKGEARALQIAEGAFGAVHARAAGAKQTMLASAHSESTALQIAEGFFNTQHPQSGSHLNKGRELRALQIADRSFGRSNARAAGGKQTMLASAQRIASAPRRVLEEESFQAYIKAKRQQEVRAAVSNYAFAADVDGGDAFVSAKHIRAENREVAPAPVLRSIASGAVNFPGRTREGSRAVRRYLQSNGQALRVRREMARREEIAVAEAAQGI